MWSAELAGVGQVDERVLDGDLAVRVRRSRSRRTGSPARSAGRRPRRTGSCSDTPVIRTARVRAPQPTRRRRRRCRAPAVTDPRRAAAFGSSACGSASAIIASALVDRALHAGGDDRLAGEPAAGRWTPTSTAKITASAAAMVAAASGLAARGALGLDGDRSRRPSRPLPRGLGGHVGVRDARRARGDRDQATGLAGRGRVAGAQPRRPAAGCVADHVEHERRRPRRACDAARRRR